MGRRIPVSYISGALDGPFIVLFEQDGAHEADDGVLVGKLPAPSVRRFTSPLARSIGLLLCSWSGALLGEAHRVVPTGDGPPFSAALASTTPSRQDRRTSRGGPTASSTVTDGSKRPGNCISGSHLRRLALIEGAADCRIRPRTGRAAPGPYPSLPLGAPFETFSPP